MTTLLEVKNLSKRFGGLQATKNVSFTLREGEIVGLIGPNGAGKTTLVNLITGVLTASEGSVVFRGRDVTRQRPFEAARSGLARTFQIVQPFPHMTVLENVTAGSLFAAGAASRAQAEREAMAHLEFVGLGEQAHRPASSLTLPSRKRLELAKSLAMNPRVLLLDEVNAGLNTSEIEKALALMRAIAARGITILLIEHLMKVVLSLSQRVLVLHHGELISEGEPQAVISDPRVVEAYLGSKFAARQQAQASANGGTHG
ncbi:Branched-chain amino acid transport ATP-binding protein LivG (TC 3.A.1.4.1) [plant metagenome]|uniref:Branched-chain amino acid transport ATP-binding protein LivG (TC 3.A.1.4.1) n=2 Tax=root TaxID=1 RepID=A0A1C3K6X1_9BURK|nr:ABC transporter ATP-binding protein [Orrella dioscoreae]SBT27194.1 Branched-chain amino acid transport ATP-binding protein LivG (TC 3.A.1.4.1) [Orrella dioscoreae]SOE46074.1 Branched-chain amino acid transport ATP-binding protein LivG (TC 3.A.1.4.1) [Orrella dioscoreae]